ncbi:MAG: flagellar biosynthetic protein FliR [Acidobacteriota bacterium]
MIPIELTSTWLPLYLLVLARVGGIVSFAPFWNLAAAPKKVRVMLALVLTLIITPLVATHLGSPPRGMLELMIACVIELVIGCVYGFVGQLIFSGLEIAAQILSSQMGFSLAATINPLNRLQTTPLATLAQLFGLVILLAADGHHWLLAALVRSYHTIAPGAGSFSAELANLLIRLSADALAVGVALAAPALVVLLAVEFVLAAAGRAAPQLQILLLGFPIKIAIAFWLIGVSLYFLPSATRDVLSMLRVNLTRVLMAMQ